MTAKPTLRFPEFIALLALLMATGAYSTDAMLPALQTIGNELSPGAPERAQMVLTIYLVGLGVGTFIAGPLSDTFGRKNVILGGIALYMLAAVVAAQTSGLAMLLTARFVQGLGVAAPRVVSQALVRDLYSGRIMARVISFGFMIFSLVPAAAPLVGSTLTDLFGWRAIFWSFVAFGAISALWFGFRQPETLERDKRRPLNGRALWGALREVLGHRQVRFYLLALSFVYLMLFAWLGQVAGVFVHTFSAEQDFPFWFAVVALLAAPSSLLNARLVVRLGMRAMIWFAIAAVALASIAIILMSLGGGTGFSLLAFLVFMVVCFSSMGFFLGNLNALALVPMGHIAGMASSTMNGVSTVLAAVIATPVGMLGDGSPLPLALTCVVSVAMTGAFMALAGRSEG